MHLLSRPKAALVLTLAILAVVSLVTLSELGYQGSAVAAKIMAVEQKRQSALQALLQQVLDAETGQWGYLLTGDEKYLTSYVEATHSIIKTLDSLRVIYVDDTPQLTRFSEMAGAASLKLSEFEVTIKIRQAGGDSENWMQIVRADMSRIHMNATRNIALEMIATAAESMKAAQLQIDRSLTISRIGVTLAALLFLLAFILYLRQTEKLDVAGQTQRKLLAIERDGLEHQVRERTARLTVLANHLQKVQEMEREHLAREMHDELGALLTAAKLDVARIQSKLVGDNESLTLRLTHLSETLNLVIALKRKIVEDLRPSSLSNLGLVAALDILVREFSEHTGLAITTAFEKVLLHEDAELTVYRVVQESLTNISKYAQAKKITVTMQAHGQYIELDVRDDGIGFDLDSRLNASHGFAGMRHRIEALNGTLDVVSSAGCGTTIHVVLPKFIPSLPEPDATVLKPNQS